MKKTHTITIETDTQRTMHRERGTFKIRSSKNLIPASTWMNMEDSYRQQSENFKSVILPLFGIGGQDCTFSDPVKDGSDWIIEGSWESYSD